MTSFTNKQAEIEARQNSLYEAQVAAKKNSKWSGSSRDNKDEMVADQLSPINVTKKMYCTVAEALNRTEEPKYVRLGMIIDRIADSLPYREGIDAEKAEVLADDGHISKDFTLNPKSSTRRTIISTYREMKDIDRKWKKQSKENRKLTRKYKKLADFLDDNAKDISRYVSSNGRINLSITKLTDYFDGMDDLQEIIYTTKETKKL